MVPEDHGRAGVTEDEGRVGGWGVGIRGGRSLTDPEGQSDEAKLEEWSHKAADCRQLTNVEPDG